MTEYELVDNALTYYNSAMAAFAMYITVLSGYVIAAFVAGERLNRAQVSIVNALFVCITVFLTIGTVACYSRTSEYAIRLLEFDPNRAARFNEFVPMYIGVIQILGIVSCLYFMWSSRHTKAK